MARKYLGSGVTNSDGVASFNYTGKGLGKIQVVAESGELVSTSYDLYDVLWKDLGVSATSSSDSAWNTTSSISVDVGNEYTELTQATSGSFGARTFQVPTGHTTFEFDVYPSETTSETVPAIMSLRNNGVSVCSIVSTTQGIQRNVWQHIKLEILENATKCRVTVDDNPSRDWNITGTYNRFQFSINAEFSDLGIRYRNFIVY